MALLLPYTLPVSTLLFFNMVNTAAFKGWNFTLLIRSFTWTGHFQMSSVTSLVLSRVRRNISKQNLVYIVYNYAIQTIKIIQ